MCHHKADLLGVEYIAVFKRTAYNMDWSIFDIEIEHGATKQQCYTVHCKGRTIESVSVEHVLGHVRGLHNCMLAAPGKTEEEKLYASDAVFLKKTQVTNYGIQLYQR